MYRCFRGFCRLISLILVGKSAQNILQEDPRQNPLKSVQQKSRHISAEGPSQQFEIMLTQESTPRKALLGTRNHTPTCAFEALFRAQQTKIGDSGKGKIHKHKQILGDCPGTGCVPKHFSCVFWGHALWARKHINKIPWKSWDKPVKLLFMFRNVPDTFKVLRRVVRAICLSNQTALMVETYRELNCSGAPPILSGPKL